MVTITSPGYAPARAASPIRLTARGRRVLMAVVTTLMASPVFELVYGRQARSEGKVGQPHAEE